MRPPASRFAIGYDGRGCQAMRLFSSYSTTVLTIEYEMPSRMCMPNFAPSVSGSGSPCASRTVPEPSKSLCRLASFSSAKIRSGAAGITRSTVTTSSLTRLSPKELDGRALEVGLALDLHPVPAPAVDPQVCLRHARGREQRTLNGGNSVIPPPAQQHRLADLVHLAPQRHRLGHRRVVERRVRVLQVLDRTRLGRGLHPRRDEVLVDEPRVEDHGAKPGDDLLARRVGVELHQPGD